MWKSRLQKSSCPLHPQHRARKKIPQILGVIVSRHICSEKLLICSEGVHQCDESLNTANVLGTPVESETLDLLVVLLVGSHHLGEYVEKIDPCCPRLHLQYSVSLLRWNGSNSRWSRGGQRGTPEPVTSTPLTQKPNTNSLHILSPARHCTIMTQC